MPYTYKYIPASMSIVPKSGSSPKNVYVELFEETLSNQFYNSSDWWTIQEETSIGSEAYTNVDVRINHVINAETGLKLGDDWKTLLFKEINHDIELGKIYIFDNNVWITINIETVKNLSGTCTIRRCNNTLRWIDEFTGAYYEEPCAIEYLVKEPRDYATQGSPFMTPGGFLHIEMQLNDRTNLIKENQRFLFGNARHWTGYKVVGTGINDFKNIHTYDNESANILTLDLIANFVNDELDDIVNGIADSNTNLYTVTLDKTSASGSPTSVIQLNESIIYNGHSVTRPMEWESSSTGIATVSGSGLVTLVSTGSCIITGNIVRSSASASCLITVISGSATNTSVIINPDINYVLEGTTTAYSVYLYENDVVQADTFTFTCSGSSVPSTSYVFTPVDGNHFTIRNILRNDTSYLPVVCTTSGSITETFNIYLKGGWMTA